MVETLGIIIDRRPKGRPRKMESWTIEKIGCPYLFTERLREFSIKGKFVYKKILSKEEKKWIK